jgi:hypothetical protein
MAVTNEALKVAEKVSVEVDMNVLPNSVWNN